MRFKRVQSRNKAICFQRFLTLATEYTQKICSSDSTQCAAPQERLIAIMIYTVNSNYDIGLVAKVRRNCRKEHLKITKKA